MQSWVLNLLTDRNIKNIKMEKIIRNITFIGLLVCGLTSCEKPEIYENDKDAFEEFGTGQGEVGDPGDQDDEEGDF